MSKRLLVAALVGLMVFVAAAGAQPTDPYVISTTTQQTGGEWLYEYEIVNPLGSPGNVWDFYVEIFGDPIDVFTPDLDADPTTDEWYSFYGTGYGFVQWTADFGYEVGVGSSLDGFGFTSMFGPTSGWLGLATDDIPYSIFKVPGDVPGHPQVIPEPATIVLTGFGLVAVGLRRFRSKRKRA